MTVAVGCLIFAWPLSMGCRWGEWSSWEQAEQAKHWHTGIQTDTQRKRERESRHLAGRQCGVSVRGGEGRGGSDTYRTMWLHARATRAAAAAAVPEQSPPAAQLWGATPESPYWSLEWAETHFLWAQATWRKEQKGLRQVVVKWWEGRGGEGCGGEGSGVRVR